MAPGGDVTEPGWVRWRIERNRRGLRTGLLFVVTLYPAFGLLDWALAPPGALAWLWGTRAAVLVLALALLRALQDDAIDRHLDLAGMLSGWATATGISV